IEKAKKIHSELISVLGKESVDHIFDNTYKEFKAFYAEIGNFNLVKDVLPFQKIIQDNFPETRQNEPKNQPTKLAALSQREIFENILDGFVLFDAKGTIIDCNHQAIRIFNTKRELLQTKSIYNFLPSHLSQLLEDDINIRASIIEKQIIGNRIESQLSGHLNQANHYEITITNNYTEGADTYSMFLKDITYTKETLKTIEEAKINAERIAKAKSTFLSNMSHEIRTPLNVILGLSSLIKNNKTIDKELLTKNLEGIDFSAKNLLAIVNDILDFSKIEAGKLSLQSIDFNVRKVVTNLAEGFEIKSIEKGLQLSCHIDENVPEIVIGDQYRLNQILNNLIGNAIKFTKEGAIKVTVTTIAKNEHDITVQFSVEDSGIGISKEDVSHIFESFYQVDDQNSTKGIGTGLGLTITKELINIQNGELQVQSTPDVGSIFQFTLPFKLSQLKGLDNTVVTHRKKEAQLSSLKILVAEDNEMNQFYIKQLLSKLNVAVDIAENGKEAVSIFESAEHQYDLIMMDMHMPVMNGLEAIRLIRQSNKDRVKKVPIVACTADVFPETRKEAIKAGIDFYLTKPLSEEAIKEVLFWLISDEELPVEQPIKTTPEISEPKEVKKYVDITTLLDTFDNDTEFITTLLEVFIKTTPEDYKSMRHCMEKEYYPRASSLAHKLKSSFMNLGMTELGHHLQQIEKNTISTSGLPDAQFHFKAFNKHYTKALLEVNKLMLSLKEKSK
ncbi:MAG: response regulator, partial [Bacteroidetes bacterium]|nr:response regulator [Bacteroidota bacterium]